MSIEIGALIGLLAGASHLATWVIARKTANREQGKESGIVLTELGYIKAGVDDVKRKQEQSDRQYMDLLARVTGMEARMDRCQACSQSR